MGVSQNLVFLGTPGDVGGLSRDYWGPDHVVLDFIRTRSIPIQSPGRTSAVSAKSSLSSIRSFCSAKSMCQVLQRLCKQCRFAGYSCSFPSVKYFSGFADTVISAGTAAVSIAITATAATTVALVHS